MGASTVLDVQVLNLETLSWSTPLLDGAPPEARSRHTANKNGESIYLFGGGDNKKLFNDVWALDFSRKLWSPVATTGTPPSPRWGHTATLVDSRLFIFGGHDGASRLNDVHVLDLQNLVWSQPDCRSRPPPSPRSLTTPTPTSPTGGSFSASGEELESQESAPNTCASSPASQSTLATPPSPKEQSPHQSRSSRLTSSDRSSANNGEISTKESPVPPLLSSLSGTSSLSSSSSSLMVDSNMLVDSLDGVPPARAGHSANCLGRKIVIYGGGDGKLLGDMYYLNVDTFEWCMMESGNVPDRCAHTSEVVYAPGGSRMLVFGGSNGIKTFNDLYLVTYSKNRVRTTSQKRKSNSILKNSDSALKSPPSNDSPLTASSPTGASPTLSPSSSTASVSANNSSTTSPTASHAHSTVPSPATAASYKDVLKSIKEGPKKLTEGDKKKNVAAPVVATSVSEKDPLYKALKDVGLDKHYAKFVEQEVTLGQIAILNESHFQSLGLTSIRDKALMAKLKENVLASSHQSEKGSFTTITGPKQAKVMKTSSEPSPVSSPSNNRTYAQAASLPSSSLTPAAITTPTPTHISPPATTGSTTRGSSAAAASATHHAQSPNSGASELARKVQLSADALASAADSLRAAASRANQPSA